LLASAFMKALFKDLLPPFFIRIIKRSGMLKSGLFWKGSFRTWNEALSNTTGYDSDAIVEKVKKALLKVKSGEAAYERDSVLFHKVQYDWEVLASLMWVAAQSGHLHVLDFGGSLGSTYFQNRAFLKNLPDVKWNVVEQAHFVKCGKESFEDDQLKFYYDIESCIISNKINIVILSSVLPYLEAPYEFFTKIEQLDVNFVLIDKMPLIDQAQDRLTIQKVPSRIYDASYPAWFFSKSKFYSRIEKNYDVVADFEREISANIPSVFKGFLLVKKNVNESS
jgi:putative methyltransferase (TIGR04325 family)